MIPKEVLAQVEKMLESVVAHGYGELNIVVQDGLIVQMKDEYSHKVRYPHLTEIPNVSIIEITT